MLAWLMIGMPIGIGLLWLVLWNDLDTYLGMGSNAERLVRAAGLAMLPAWIAAGIGALKGRNWARLLLPTWPVLGLAESALEGAGAWKMLGDLILVALFASFLFNRRADAFFGRSYFRDRRSLSPPRLP